MQKEFRSIETLRNWDKNPRAIKKDKFEELKRRIIKRGQFKPLIITPDGEVLGGNMRLRAMKELGVKDVWVSVVEPKDEADKIEIALTDNEEMGYYEEQALAELIAEFQQDIDLTKYSVHLEPAKTLKEILDEVSPEEVIEDDAPEVQENPASELGKVYQLGRHRVMCGDSTKIEDVEKLMDGKKADMVCSDPPYGISYEESKNWSKPDYIKRPIIGDDKPFDFQHTCWPKVGIWCIWGANYFSNTIPNFFDGNYVVWAKAHSDQENDVFGSSFELAWMYPKHKQMIWYVRRINMGKEEHGLHVTQKPIEVMTRAMDYHSLPKNKLVVDLFLGSGSTLIACEQTNRICYGMELDPKYVDVIRKRYAKFVDPENWEDRWQEMTPETAN